MEIHIQNLTKRELEAVIRACNTIEEQGAETYLTEKQITDIKNRIQELEICNGCELQQYIKQLKETK